MEFKLLESAKISPSLPVKKKSGEYRIFVCLSFFHVVQRVASDNSLQKPDGCKTITLMLRFIHLQLARLFLSNLAIYI